MGLDLHHSRYCLDVDDRVLPQLIDLLIQTLEIIGSWPKQFFAGAVNLPAIPLKIFKQS